MRLILIARDTAQFHIIIFHVSPHRSPQCHILSLVQFLLISAVSVNRWPVLTVNQWPVLSVNHWSVKLSNIGQFYLSTIGQLNRQSLASSNYNTGCNKSLAPQTPTHHSLLCNWQSLVLITGICSSIYKSSQSHSLGLTSG